MKFIEKIIFLHIEKVAGSSQREWFYRHFGRDNVYWHGITSEGAIDDSFLIGGHESFDYYEKNQNFIYLSLVRDPIERVLSFYNYCKNVIPESWIPLGLDISSFKNTILSCDHFRNAIRNGQCRYISGSFLFEDTVKCLEKYSFLIGELSNLEVFNKQIEEKLYLDKIPIPKKNVGVLNYKDDIDIDSECINELNLLLEEDFKLFNFIKVDHHGLYLSVKNSDWKDAYAAYKQCQYKCGHCSSEIKLLNVTLKPGYDIVHAQALRFEIEFALDREIAELEAGIHIWDTQKRWAFGTNSTLQKQVIYNVLPGIYHIIHYVIADLPEGVYTAGFAFAEKLPDGSSNELMWYDKLCEFRVSHPAERVGIGYANLPATVALTQTNSFNKNLISDGSGRIDSMAIPLEMKLSERINLDVEIQNDTDVAWMGDLFRPINLSYHWLDENDNVILLDGVRTSLPDGGVCSHGSALASMEIVAPEQKGKYKLILTMVQESVRWFEDMGFQPFVTEIEVKY